MRPPAVPETVGNILTAFALGFDSADLAEQAKSIANRYHFYIDQHKRPRLQLTHQGLVLLIDKFSPLKVDFNPFILPSRAANRHGLLRACKLKPSMTLIDLTAGWGQDAGLIAQQGARVTMLERQPIMAALLEDGLERASPSRLALTCVHQDALTYLTQLAAEDYPEIIYLDPMHPQRQKSALVKKDMQALQQLLGPDDDAKALLATALACATVKVVVKWPQRLPPLHPPDASIPGKTVRFDLYARKIAKI